MFTPALEDDEDVLKDVDVVCARRRRVRLPLDVAVPLRPAAGADAGDDFLLSVEELAAASSEAFMNLRIESLTPRKFLQLEQVRRVHGLDSVKSKTLIPIAFPASS